MSAHTHARTLSRTHAHTHHDTHESASRRTKQSVDHLFDDTTQADHSALVASLHERLTAQENRAAREAVETAERHGREVAKVLAKVDAIKAEAEASVRLDFSTKEREMC